MKTFADLKRAIKPGVRMEVLDHEYRPELNGSTEGGSRMKLILQTHSTNEFSEGCEYALLDLPGLATLACATCVCLTSASPALRALSPVPVVSDSLNRSCGPKTQTSELRSAQL